MGRGWRCVIEIFIKIACVARIRGYTQGAGRTEHVFCEGGVEGEGDTLEGASGMTGGCPVVLVLIWSVGRTWVGMSSIASFHVGA